MRKSLLILVFLVLAINGCRKATSTAQQSPPASTSAAPVASQEFAHPQGGAMAATDTKYFKGSIGNALDLQMKLVRDDDKLSGQYFYQKIGTRIDLKGSIDKNNNVLLEEFDPAGKQTGIFKGLWSVSGEDGLVSIAGNWSKPDGQKQTAFSLHEEPISLSNGVEVTAKNIKESNKKLKYDIDVEYPQLTGMLTPPFEKFNSEANKLTMREVNEFKKNIAENKGPEDTDLPNNYLDTGYTIALANDDVISIQFDVGTYYRGAAHPNSNSEVLNFDVKNGRVLKLADLFKPGSNYVQRLSTFSIKDLKRQSKAKGEDSGLDDQTIESGAGPDAKNFRSWTVSKKGLAITFDAYQVGPYVAGPQSVLVPFSILKDVIEPNGVLGSLTKPQL